MVVVVQVRRQAGLDYFVRCFVCQSVAEAFFLYGPVKAFDVRIVVRPAQPTVTHGDASVVQTLCKVPPKLRAVVGLHHGKAEPKAVLGSQDRSCS